MKNSSWFNIDPEHSTVLQNRESWTSFSEEEVGLLQLQLEAGRHSQGVSWWYPTAIARLVATVQGHLRELRTSRMTVVALEAGLTRALTEELPSGMTLDEQKFYCLGVISEQDFEKGQPRMIGGDGEPVKMSNKYLKEEARTRIEEWRGSH